MKSKLDIMVYSLLKEIPKGKVTTYKEIAEVLGMKGYRAIGQSLKRNERPVLIPCHRVVKSTGEVGGYAGDEEEHSSGVKRKIMLLEKEGIEIKNNRIDLNKYLHTFK